MRIGISLFVLLFWLGTSTLSHAQKSIIYAGTFSQRGSQGIYVFQFDRAKATLKQVQTVPGLESPSFLTTDKTGRFLYSVNRGRADVNDKGGSVSAYAINPKTGFLSGLNTRSSYGEAPCFISLDRSNKHAFICNYLGANLLVLPIFTDGLLGVPSDSKKYFGSSVNAERQTEPHIHSSYPSPDNRFLYVCDLGTDKVYVYRFDAATGRLSDAETPYTSVNPGSGPRHLAFHPNGKFAYVVEELTSTVCVMNMNSDNGALTVLQDTVRALPSSFTGTNTSADIHFHPSGKFMYMSNRGHNSISVFSVGADGVIKLLDVQPIAGKTPRNFLIEPKGEFMLVANQDSDNIILFRIDAKTGKLKPVGKPVAVPAPACLAYLAIH
ncbi:MAG: lactonase family protein [Chryseolinea sp.]